MSYLGRRGATAPLNSADIPADIVEGTDIAYLENDSTTQNLGGTYSTERMYLNDSYTLNDDVTVTGHLALGSIADSDVVITNDSSARTITGSGTLEAGRLMNDFQSSLTGMTGELGSGVTIGNATFPVGHVIKTYFAKQTIDISQNSATPTVIPGLTLSITPVSSSSKFLITFHAGGYVDSGTDTVFTWRIYGNGSYIGTATGATDGECSTGVFYQGSGGTTVNNMPTGAVSGSLFHAPASTSVQVYDVRVFLGFGSGSYYHPEPSSQLSILEIQG